MGVLLVVLELGPRRLLDVAARLDEGAHLLGGLVGVDLVAEEQHEVGQPVGREVGVVRVRRVDLVGQPQRPCAQRVHPVRLVAASSWPTDVRHEPKAMLQRPAVLERGDDGLGKGEPGSGHTCWPSTVTV